MQDTGVIQGISQAPETISFKAMSEKQQELAKAILQDPAASGESFLHLLEPTAQTRLSTAAAWSINLKPLEDRNLSALRRDPQAPVQPEERSRNRALHAAGAKHYRG